MSTPSPPLSPLSVRSTTPSPPPSPTFWRDLSSSAMPPMSENLSENQPDRVQRILRPRKRDAMSHPTMEHRPRPSKKHKANFPSSDEPSSPPPPYSYVRTETKEEETIAPYDHLRPPFEKFWDADAVPVPVVHLPDDRPRLEKGAVLYFAYGKDMDPAYLKKLFTSSGVTASLEFVAVGKLSKYTWVLEASSRFPMILPDGEGEVWGLVYLLAQPCLDVLNSKAKKRHLKMQELEVETFKKTGELGFWNAPLLPLDKAAVHVMVGNLDNGGDRMEIDRGENRKLEGSKKRKVLAGLLWGATEGLPERYKAEIREKAGGIKDPRDTMYWTMSDKLPKRLMGETHPKWWDASHKMVESRSLWPRWTKM